MKATDLHPKPRKAQPKRRSRAGAAVAPQFERIFQGAGAGRALTLLDAAWLLAGMEKPNDRDLPDLVLEAMRWIMENVPPLRPAPKSKKRDSPWYSVPNKFGSVVSNRDEVVVLRLLEAAVRLKPAFPGLMAAWDALSADAKRGQVFHAWLKRGNIERRPRRVRMERAKLQAALVDFSPLFGKVNLETFNGWANTELLLKQGRGRRPSK